MRLNWGDLYYEYTTIWIMNKVAFQRMLQFAAFEIIAESTLIYPNGAVPRHAVLVRARNPLEARKYCGNDEWLCNILTKNTPGLSSEFLKPQLDPDYLSQLPQAVSSLKSQPEKQTTVDLGKIETYKDEVALYNMATPAWKYR
jgi:hypothetical protein